MVAAQRRQRQAPQGSVSQLPPALPQASAEVAGLLAEGSTMDKRFKALEGSSAVEDELAAMKRQLTGETRKPTAYLPPPAGCLCRGGGRSRDSAQPGLGRAKPTVEPWNPNPGGRQPFSSLPKRSLL